LCAGGVTIFIKELIKEGLQYERRERDERN
jgi:hypothetical protein